MDTTAIRIDPNGVYSPRDLARITATGPQTWYKPIRAGKLKAAKINSRNDLRVVGAWAIAYLETLAEQNATETLAKQNAT